uniref:MFS transporter n=1 Tax=Lentilactobacillus hilgardii TaxID=1588 RepID=UPI00403F8BBC
METKVKRSYFSLIFSPFASQLGSAIYLLGLNWLIVRMTGNTKLLGIIEGIGGIGFLLGDLLVGRLVDQYNRKVVLVGTDLMSALMCLVGGIIVDNQKPQIWLLLTITFVLNLMLAINFPAAKAIAPEIIDNAGLQRFNAIANMFFNFASVLAPLIGGVLLAIKSIEFNEFLMINAMSFVIAILLNLLISYQPTKRLADQEPQSILKSNLIGFAYVKKHPKLIMNLFSMAIFNFCFAGYLLAAPYISSHFFGGRSENYSLFLTIYAVGGLIGGIWLTLEKRIVSIRVIYYEELFYGTVLIICGTFLSFFTWILIALICGIVQARFFGSIATLIQNETDLEFLGRVFGLTYLCFDGIQPLGNFLFGFFISSWQHWTYVVIGIFLIVPFGIMLYFERQAGQRKAD